MNELKLLKYCPIEVKQFKVYPLTLEEIVDMGEETYNLYIQSLMLTKNDIKKLINPDAWNNYLNIDEFEKLNDFEALLFIMLFVEEIKNVITSSLSLFLKESVDFNFDDGLFVERGNEREIITKYIFDRIKEVISLQNNLKNSSAKEEEFNPFNDKARELIEKRNKFKKMLEQQKAENNLNLSDIISVVASLSPSYNFENIWKLTVYQLYTIFERMAMKDNYETQIYLLPHSSDNKTELKHWMSKINKNN